MKTLLFLNGWAADATIWQSVLEHLKQDSKFKCSGVLLNNWSIQCIDWLDIETSKDFDSITADALHTSEQVVVVAWSTGTLAAVRAAAQFPDRIVHMVLISPTAKFTSSKDWDYGWQKSVLLLMQRRLRQVPVGTLHAFYHKCDPLLPKRDIQQFVKRIEPFTDKRRNALVEGLQYLVDTDTRNLLPSLQCNVSMFTGLDDEICEAEATRQMARAIPSAQLQELTDGAHLLPLTHSKRLAMELAHILKHLEDTHD